MPRQVPKIEQLAVDEESLRPWTMRTPVKTPRAPAYDDVEEDMNQVLG
jgi:hypothetical protein